MSESRSCDPVPTPPVAPREPHRLELHGDRRVDDYFWLRDKDAPRVLAYLRAENDYTRARLRSTEPLQEALYQEMLGRIEETDRSAPWAFAGWLWYTRTEAGLGYPIHARRRGGLDAPEEVVLDLNELAAGKAYLALGAFALTAAGDRLAYSVDETGFREHSLHVKDLGSGQRRAEPLSLRLVDTVAWAADGETLFYVTEDPETKRPFRLWRLRVGDASAATLIYEEEDERFDLSIERSRSLAWLFLRAESLTASEIRVIPAADPGAAPRLVAAREAEHEYDIDHAGDRFYIRSNGGGRRNFRLLTTAVDDPAPAAWRELVPHRDEVMLEGADLFAGSVVLWEREHGLPQIAILDLATGRRERVTFPESCYQVGPARNAEFAAPGLRYEYQSPVTPPSVFERDFSGGATRLVKREEVRGGFDPGRYDVCRLEARAEDGVRVPVSLVTPRGAARDGKAPLLLAGYGAYGIPSDPRFSVTRLSLLERGVGYAIAHVRGGGELGKRWHDQGRMAHKKHSFGDFIAAAEHLIAEGFTSPDGLVITGGSAGGLLVGAVANMRPELFRGVLAVVPFVDVINTMLDESLPLTTAEFEEWGNPRIEAEYRQLSAYSPYDNVCAQAYPAMLVRAAYNDSQVPYWEAAKWVAKLRTLKIDANPLLLEMNLEPAGHGGRSGRYDRLRESALEVAWILDLVGARR